MSKHRHDRGSNQPSQARGLTSSVTPVDELGYFEVPTSTTGEEEMTGNDTQQVMVSVEEPKPSPLPPPIEPKTVQVKTASPAGDFVQFLHEYVSERAKGATAIAAKQYTLYQRLMAALRLNDASLFRAHWSEFLHCVHRHSTDAFSITRVFEAPHSWPGSQTEYTTFRRIVTLAIVTCDPATRSASLKQHINFDISVVTLGETERNNLIAYYNL